MFAGGDFDQARRVLYDLDTEPPGKLKEAQGEMLCNIFKALLPTKSKAPAVQLEQSVNNFLVTLQADKFVSVVQEQVMLILVLCFLENVDRSEFEHALSKAVAAQTTVDGRRVSQDAFEPSCSPAGWQAHV